MRICLFSAALVLLAATAPARAADPAATSAQAAPPAAAASNTNGVAALVGNKPVYIRQVEQMFAAATHGQQMSPETAARMKAAVLLQLVERQLAQTYLDKAGIAATADEIDAEITHMKSELDRLHQTLPQYLARSGQTETTMRSDVGWQVSWQKFLRAQLTEESLEAYFNAHRREFDGTQLRVSHILLRPATVGNDAAVATLVKEADQIRQQIVSGRITFEAAAEKYSAGPSRHRGGDLGFIPRHGEMAEPFAKAAFALKKGEISEPVATVFGIHLIRMTDVKPGDRTLDDVRDAVKTSLTEYLFTQLVARELGAVPVQYTGQVPFFKPGTTGGGAEGSGWGAVASG